jgi:NADH:ubiquinone oxidoreductase subunit H
MWAWLGELVRWNVWPDYARSTFWIIGVTVALILSVAFTTLWERKVIGWMQLRRGPNRVGSIFGFLPGIFQPFADVIKLLIKEVVIPAESNKVLFRIAPMITLIPAFAIWAVIPLDPNLVIADVNAGLLYVLALTSVGVYVEVRLPRRHALGRPDRGLRDRHGLRAGGRDHGGR